MPYNNTPIAPPKEFTGSVALPLARVKKIINADEEIGNCSNNAAFVITIATEMFVQHLVEKTHEVIKAEKKPRRNVQYNDVANAVARLDNLEFLSDVVPRTTTYKKWAEEKARKEAAAKAAVQAKLPNGQTTIDLTNDSVIPEAGPSNCVPPSTPRMSDDPDRMQLDISPAKSEYWDPTAQARSPPNRRQTLDSLTNGSGERPNDQGIPMQM